MRPRLSCDQCGFKTTSEAVQKQHKILNHSKNGFTNHKTSKRKKCAFCEKQFNKEETYKKHIQSTHEMKALNGEDHNQLSQNLNQS